MHEGEKHNYRCDVCDEGFLVEEDLASHKTTHEVQMDVENSSKDNEASQCDECGMIFENTTDLNDHQASEHVSETVANETESNGQEKAENVQDKQLENDALKEMIRRLELESNQSKQLLKAAEEQLEDEKRINIAANKEKAKNIKDNEAMMKGVIDQLDACREEIKNYVVDNTKLKEENCVLKEIIVTKDRLKDRRNPNVNSQKPLT